MTSKWLPVSLPIIGLVACGVGVLLHLPSGSCDLSSWMCMYQGMMGDFWMMAAPLFVLVVRGIGAGIVQLYRTNVTLRQILSCPDVQLSPHVTVLARTLGIERYLDVIEAPDTEAFCYGILRPRICITSGLINALSIAELEAVLRHERHHLGRHDPLRVVLWTVISNMCWWLESDARQARLHRELAADRAVIVEQGRTPLASALYKLVTLSGTRHIPQSGLALTGISITDARIDQLLQPDSVPQVAPRLWRWLLLPLLLLLTLLLCSGIMAHLWA